MAREETRGDETRGEEARREETRGDETRGEEARREETRGDRPSSGSYSLVHAIMNGTYCRIRTFRVRLVCRESSL